MLLIWLYKLHIEEVMYAWQAWMHELQVEDRFSVPFQSYEVYNFV
jgi:hypothetical protein